MPLRLHQQTWLYDRIGKLKMHIVIWIIYNHIKYFRRQLSSATSQKPGSLFPLPSEGSGSREPGLFGCCALYHSNTTVNYSTLQFCYFLAILRKPSHLLSITSLITSTSVFKCIPCGIIHVKCCYHVQIG
jgi:hypothetical protein